MLWRLWEGRVSAVWLWTSNFDQGILIWVESFLDGWFDEKSQSRTMMPFPKIAFLIHVVWPHWIMGFCPSNSTSKTIPEQFWSTDVSMWTFSVAVRVIQTLYCLADGQHVLFPCAAISIQDRNLVLAVSPCQWESYLYLFSDNRVDLFSSVVLSSGRKVTTLLIIIVRISPCSWQREVDSREFFPSGLLSCGSSP